MLNARTQGFFFIWGANKNVNAEKKGALYIKERFIYILPCIHIWMFCMHTYLDCVFVPLTLFPTAL